MEKTSLTYFFNYPNENAFLVFVLGMLFVLTIYHFLLYFQHKDKTYLFYSFYTFLIFFSHLYKVEGGFIPVLIEPIKPFLGKYYLFMVWLYNMTYFVFAFTFINIKSYNTWWYHFIFRSISFLFFITVIIDISYRLTGNIQYYRVGDVFFILYISVLAIICYIPLFKAKGVLKYYIIIGSLFLFISSLLATFIYYFKLYEEGDDSRYTIFYIGIILENILFSLGLGHKQKLILEDRNKSQEQLIKQYLENEKLREEVQKKLELNIEVLNKQAELKKLEVVKMQYDKDLAELTVSTLRNQMNPHFIFNSLNSIKRYIIDNDKKEAVFYLNKFSKLIRKILRSTIQTESSLEEELEILELYMNIENTRLNNTVILSINVDTSLNLSTIKVPPLITQPFIENAIWHGLAPKKTNRELKIEVLKANKNQVQINIVDNGIGREKSERIKEKKLHKRASVGIQLTKERLQHFSRDFKNPSSIMFTDLYENDKPLGTKVSIFIPLS